MILSVSGYGVARRGVGKDENYYFLKEFYDMFCTQRKKDNYCFCFFHEFFVFFNAVKSSHYSVTDITALLIFKHDLYKISFFIFCKTLKADIYLSAFLDCLYIPVTDCVRTVNQKWCSQTPVIFYGRFTDIAKYTFVFFIS